MTNIRILARNKKEAIQAIKRYQIFPNGEPTIIKPPIDDELGIYEFEVRSRYRTDR